MLWDISTGIAKDERKERRKEGRDGRLILALVVGVRVDGVWV
jgi:hypothetical protein